ncbi:hypothetical protein AB6A40_001153 [Gnathostoma spinigerum]|uniref:Uncharacterized protein n=1 Tax=Gnathostoma spinigerum TaxID=75299 RepID=A0ABD6E3I4_9BILA
MRNGALSVLPQLKEFVEKMPRKRRPTTPLSQVPPVLLSEEEYYGLPQPVRKIVDEYRLLRKNPRTNKYELVPESILRLPSSQMEQLRNEDLSNVPELKELVERMPRKRRPSTPLSQVLPVVLSEEEYYGLPQTVRKMVRENRLLWRNPVTNQ